MRNQLEFMLGETMDIIDSATKYLDNGRSINTNRMMGNTNEGINNISMDAPEFYHSNDQKLWDFEKQCKKLEEKQLTIEESEQLNQLKKKFAILDDILCQVHLFAISVISDEQETPRIRLQNEKLVFDIFMGRVPVPENFDWESDDGKYLQDLHTAIFNSPNEDEFRPVTPDHLSTDLLNDSVAMINEIEKIIDFIGSSANNVIPQNDLNVVMRNYMLQKHEIKRIEYIWTPKGEEGYTRFSDVNLERLAKARDNIDLGRSKLNLIRELLHD